MKRVRWYSRIAVALTLAGLAIPERALADFPAQRLGIDPAPTAEAPTSDINDVALGAGGVLTGQVVDPQGTPLAEVPITIRQQERIVATTRTAQDGRFSAAGLQGGVYQIIAGDGVAIYRVWVAQTAPPGAGQGALIVSGKQLVRGQTRGLRYWLTNPWVLAGLIGTAIAVPIALSNNDRVSTS